MAKKSTKQNRRAREIKKVMATLLTGNDEVRRFSTAAKTFGKNATSSQQKARQILIDMGIHTEAGNLTKHYRSK
jgi:hypothetical protein